MEQEQGKQESPSKTDQPQGLGPAQEMPEGFMALIQELDRLQRQVHDVAVATGQWEDDKTETEQHAVMHVDIAKATVAVYQQLPLYDFGDLEPKGEMVELADCVLHIMDYFGSLGISFGQVLARKHLHDARMVNRKKRAGGA